MNFKFYTILVMLLLSVLKTQGMEQSEYISLVDFHGQNFTLEKSAAELLMPTHFELYKHGEEINFSISTLEIKSLLTEENIKLLRDVTINPATIFISQNKINEIVKVAQFLQPQDIIFKRLGYLARQHKDSVIPQEWLNSQHTYSITELMDEPFFDINTLVTINRRTNPIGKNKQNHTEEPHKYLIDLSNYNIGSLDGLEDLKNKLKEEEKIDENYLVSIISLDNNALQSLDLKQLFKAYKYLDKVKANKNPLKEIVNTRKYTHNLYYTLSLKKTLLEKLPEFEDQIWGTIIKLHQTPLCSRARYHTRSTNVYWNTFLGTMLTCTFATLSWQAMEMALNKYSSGSFTDGTSSVKQELFKKCIKLAIPSLLYGFNSNTTYFCRTVFYITHNKKKKKQYSEMLSEIAEDCMHISYDLVTWPFRVIKRIKNQLRLS